MELFAVEGPDAGRSFPLGPSSVVGRDPTAAVSLTDEEVSRRHAILSVDEGLVRIEDLGSSNGTFVEDAQVTEEREIAPGARVRVGQTVLELRQGSVSESAEDMRPTKVPLPKLEGD
jgi:pSer/pThr/pTyr-binding forkhead associated (FHA) protein